MNDTNNAEHADKDTNHGNMDIMTKNLMRTISFCKNADRNSFGLGKKILILYKKEFYFVIQVVFL